MFLHAIADWDDAYANAPNIAGGDRWPEAWVQPAEAFRALLGRDGRARLDLPYGDRPRNRLDLFLPEAAPHGLVVFVHGGFWLRLDKSYWSHLARGAVENGYAVAIPGYSLCPEVRIGDITREVGEAITSAAAVVEGPIRLVGHSAGGQLVTRMVTGTSPLGTAEQKRVAGVLSISGLHDLRPLMRTRMNETLRLDAAEAAAESPALLEPVAGCRLVCWAGAAERSEFLRQNALLANVWKGLGAATAAVEEPDRHHFNIIDGLANPGHPLTAAAISGI